MAVPDVSVVVPIYNVARYLDQCLRSVREQTLHSIEIICADDGSTDRSPEIIAEHAAQDRRISVFTKPNTGYGDTMNQALARARGEFIAIVESDDFADSAMLESLHGLALANSADVVKANYFHYWSAGGERDEQVYVVPRGSGCRLVDPRTAHDVIYAPPSIWSGLYRRSFLQSNDIGFLPTPGASYQDTSFAFKVWATAQRAVLTDRAFLHYRQDNASSSIHSLAKAYCVCDEFAEMGAYLRRRPDLPSDLEAVRQFMRYNTYIWNCDRLDADLRVKFLQRMSDELLGDEQAGSLDFSLFDPVRRACAIAIMRSPRDFAASKAASHGSALGKARHYLHVGGPSVLLHAAVSAMHGPKVVPTGVSHGQ